MPPHVVCLECGWREPVSAAPPKAERTWDSTRDEARYSRAKKRREAVEMRRRLAASQLAVPSPAPEKPRTVRDHNVVQIKRGA